MALNLSGSDLEDEELERQVQEMAKKILEYRAILPDQLKNTFASILAAHRPAISDRSGPGTSGASSLGTFLLSGCWVFHILLNYFIMIAVCSVDIVCNFLRFVW